MIRLQGNEVVYNNSENLGLFKDMNFIEGGFSFSLPNGEIKFIPEEDSTPAEREVFNAYHEFYKDNGGIKPPNGITLEQVKAIKISELDTTCNETIRNGFYSYAHGDSEPIFYGYDNTKENPDQTRIAGQFVALTTGIDVEPVFWKGKGNVPPLAYTYEQFKVLATDALKHEKDNTTRYYGLKEQVLACSTVEEVDAIVW